VSEPNLKTRLIVNPKAGAGRAGRRLEALRRAVDGVLPGAEIRVTEAPGHARHLAMEAATDGVQLLAAVGGDGTVHETVDGLFDGDTARAPDLVFGVVPIGTGSDFRKSLDIPNELDVALRILAKGETRPVDVGHVQLTTDSGTHTERFINVAGFGANGEVVRQANQMSKRMGGTVTFFRASLKATLSYSPAELAIRWTGADDAEHTWQGRAFSVFVGNGAYCGGGMYVGKGGTMDDGLFDVTILPPSGVATQVVQARRLYDGSLTAWPGARSFRAKQVEVRAVSTHPVYLDLDGENPGRVPAMFRVLPRALRIRGRWGTGAAER
jgi:diacylglycerol kinase (ATP)